MARLALTLLLAAMALAAPAQAAPDRTVLLSATATTNTWDGPTATAVNTTFDPAACSDAPDTYCDVTLIEVSGPPGSAGELKVTTGSYEGPYCEPLEADRGPCDFSLRLYASDASGKPGRQLDESGEVSGASETVVFRRAVPGFYLAVVFYYSVVASSYEGTATLEKFTVPAPPVAGPPPAAAFPSAGALTAKLVRAGRATAKGVPVRLTCSVVCRGTVVAELSAAEARRAGLGRRRLTIARAPIAVDSASGRSVRLRFKAGVARRLARARGARVTLRATVADAARTQRAVARLSARLAR